MKLLVSILLCSSLFSQTKEIAFYSNFPVDLHALTEIVKEQDMKVVDLMAKQDRHLHKYIFWNLHSTSRKLVLKKMPKKKMVLFMWEPPTVLPKMYKKKYQRAFSKIYTWDDDLVDGKIYHKFFYPELKPMITDLPPFEEKKLCTMVIGKHTSSHPNELYSLREKMIQFFETKPKGDFTFYGRGWDATYSSYKGPIEEKIKVMKHFRFAICLENMHGKKGYITEKIFDCFAAGVIPIYLGASNVEDYIPRDCFIDLRDYSSFEELYQALKGMSKQTNETYLENIRAFLKSEKAQLFSAETFQQIFQKAAL